ncbi:MAG TPA: metal ABC transporter permease [Verrucomicrobiales bacterium]|jgi:manganese/iron transport system permease protein/iron/zinc/copper transport system permease protein|nr:metal ABC transporter permease [Verrucomicrobiales bacterium]
MPSWFNDILALPSLQRSLLAALIIGFTNGCFSAYVVLRRGALIAGSLSHALLPGIVLGVLIAGRLTGWSSFLGALFAALIVVLASVTVSRVSRLDQGTSLGVIFTVAFAAGLILFKYIPGDVKSQVKLEDYLFGDLLMLDSSDVWVAFSVSVITLTICVALQRTLLVTLFEPSVAAAQGVPVRAVQYLIMTLLVLVMVSALRAVGCMLSLGLVVAPGATVFLLTNSTRAMFWGGGVLGAVSAVGGMIIAQVTEITAGAAITAVLGTLFLLALVFSPKSGLLFRKSRPPVRPVA